MALLRFAARDPGGANVLAGFLAQHGGRFAFDVWALPRGAAVFREAGLSPHEFQEESAAAAVREAWRRQSARLLITGTSHYAAFEPLLWDIAREEGCPSLAVNDAWVNLPSRFQRGKPDAVGAVDEGQIKDLTALGFRSDQIIVTGHPWLATVMSRRHAILSSTSVPARSNGMQVLFVSEAIASDVAQGVNAPFGFDEFDSFAVVHRAAAETARAGQPVHLAIKFHPYEDPAAFLNRLPTLPATPGLTVQPLAQTEKPHPWVLWADLVTGVSSMLLLEAITLGRPVISVQPGLKREDTFIASVRGFAQTLTDPAEAPAVLGRLIRDEFARRQCLERNQRFLETLPRDPAAAILRWIEARLPA